MKAARPGDLRGTSAGEKSKVKNGMFAVERKAFAPELCVGVKKMSFGLADYVPVEGPLARVRAGQALRTEEDGK